MLGFGAPLSYVASQREPEHGGGTVGGTSQGGLISIQKAGVDLASTLLCTGGSMLP